MKKDFDEFLLEINAASPKSILFAKKQIEITGEQIGVNLHRNGLIDERNLAKALATFLRVDYIDINDTKPTPAALFSFNMNLCSTLQFIPLEIQDDKIIIAYTGCGSNISYLRETVFQQSGLIAVVKITEISKIRKLIQFCFATKEKSVRSILEKEILQVSADQQAVRPLDQLLLNLIKLAVEQRATDIHISPMEKTLDIAFRIDGMKVPFFSLDQKLTRLLSIIKIQANLDISEKRLPQDGSFQLKVNSVDYDIRVSTIAGILGESIVMRLLPNRITETLAFRELGFLEKDLKRLNNLFQIPYGLIVLTGPTGSGKTTTLHAGIQSQDTLSKNVLTIEDPVEYRIPLVLQTQVNEKAGYNFASAIRHFLRHDPDIILVGEIRDSETAKTAVTAAETGHLVLSTLHTNDVYGVIPRLQSLGLSSNILASTLSAIISQRLIRTLCPQCKTEHLLSEDEIKEFKLQSGVTLYQEVGCQFCNYTGYFGREPVYEILEITEEIASAISMNTNLSDFMKLIRANGFKSLLDVALEKALHGNVSLNEIKRVIRIIVTH